MYMYATIPLMNGVLVLSQVTHWPDREWPTEASKAAHKMLLVDLIC